MSLPEFTISPNTTPGCSTQSAGIQAIGDAGFHAIPALNHERHVAASQNIDIPFPDFASGQGDVAFDPQAFYRNCLEVIKPHLIQHDDAQFGCIAPAVSFGKDSSLVLSLLLEAANELVASGCLILPILVMTSNTGIENPLQIQLVKKEMARVREYAATHDLPVFTQLCSPTAASSWQVKVISAQGLPPVPGGSGACTEDWKVKPMTTGLNRWMRQHDIKKPALRMTGTRFKESNTRGNAMRMRGESSSNVWQNKKGEYLLSPIADLDLDDVWTLVGWFRAGWLPSYTTWDDIMGFYEKAGGSECVVVADERLGKAQQGSCSPRGGCWACTKVAKDTSLENMLSETPALDGLYRLREYVAGITFDYSRRTVFGRTIRDGGYVELSQDGFNSETCQDLLRYALTIDQVERERAQKAGEEPLFQIFDLEKLILVDVYWALHGLAPAFEAWRIQKAIVEDGQLYPVPKIVPTPRMSPPEPRYLYVGEGWETGEHDDFNYRWSGLLDPLDIAMTEDTPCKIDRTVLPNGREVPCYETSPRVRVRLDQDETWDFLQFILDDEIERSERLNLLPHYAAQVYLKYGVVEPSSLRIWDEMLRRNAFRIQNGFHRGQMSKEMLEISISKHEYECLLVSTGRQLNHSERQLQMF